jgi:cytoskeleton protein RodZ
MKSIGEKLRSEREKQGLSISEVAGQLRISTKYLEAIETGDTDAIPGGFFYRSFVRQYASVLNLNDPGFESELNALTPSTPTNFVPDQPPGHFPIEVPPLIAMSRSGDSLRKTPVALILLILVVIACSGLYSLWYRNRNASREETAQAQQSPPPAAPIVQQQPLPATAPPTEQHQPTPEPATAATPATTPAAEQPAATQPTPAQAVASDAPGARFQVSVTATEDAWISLSSSGKSLFVGVLKPGESKAIEAAGAARLIVGNAGGIDLKINGKSTGPVGPRGQPRNLTITPAGFQVKPPGA